MKSAQNVIFAVPPKSKITWAKIHFLADSRFFLQILNLINRSNIQGISKKEGYDRYVKKLDGYTHLVLLLFGVLKRYDSLRELVIGVLSEANKLVHLGISYMVRRSTLAEANNLRNCEFFEKVYCTLYRKYKGVLTDS